LLSITVLLVGIVGVYLPLSSSYYFNIYSKNRLEAAFLSQEAIEIIKNIRDTNFLEYHNISSSNPWNEGLSSGYYEVSYSDTSSQDPTLISCPAPCNFSSLHYLKKPPHSFYNYSIGNNTIFKRRVYLQQIDPEIIRVVATTFWKVQKGVHEISAEDKIYKWW